MEKGEDVRVLPCGHECASVFCVWCARGLVGTSIVCKVKHRCFVILKHCGLFCCFPMTLKQPEKRHIHGSINLSRQLEKWDPPLMTYPRRSCINMSIWVRPLQKTCRKDVQLRICPKEEDMPTDKYSKRWLQVSLSILFPTVNQTYVSDLHQLQCPGCEVEKQVYWVYWLLLLLFLRWSWGVWYMLYPNKSDVSSDVSRKFPKKLLVFQKKIQI